jgi:hypothetical protein
MSACHVPKAAIKSCDMGTLSWLGTRWFWRDAWWVRIVSAETGRPVAHRCIRREPTRDGPHPMPPGMKIPGSTRWRWLAEDESGWAECTQGCCEILWCEENSTECQETPCDPDDEECEELRQ